MCFGSAIWLQPYTVDIIRALAKRGLRKLTVVSPSFAVDCLEPLEEVAGEYGDFFMSLGGERLTLVSCLNDDDRHAELLTSIAREGLEGWVP